MQPFSRRTWRTLVGALIPVAMLMGATPALADRDDDHRWRRHHKEWRHHDRDHDRGRHWRHGHRGDHRRHWRHDHDRRIVVIRPRPRIIFRERPRVYYFEPRRHRYYEPIPGVSGSVTFRF